MPLLKVIPGDLSLCCFVGGDRRESHAALDKEIQKNNFSIKGIILFSLSFEPAAPSSWVNKLYKIFKKLWLIAINRD